jgi:alpha/beta superfamily hydrolase
MKILQRNTSSVAFSQRIIKNADHGFNGKEDELANAVATWVKSQ